MNSAFTLVSLRVRYDSAYMWLLTELVSELYVYQSMRPTFKLDMVPNTLQHATTVIQVPSCIGLRV